MSQTGGKEKSESMTRILTHDLPCAGGTHRDLGFILDLKLHFIWFVWFCGLIMGAFFWGYSGYSYSGLGITEYTEFQFRKERSYMFQIWNRNRR